MISCSLGVMFAAALAVEASAQNDEIVVTAQKREQNLQDVGISMTAFTGDGLRERGITDSTDIAGLVPNLEIGDPVGAGSQPTIFIRGVGLNDFNTNNAGPNGVYVDEVYISSPSGQSFQLFDIERVEVLRGPQGTLYGRNTTGGAINFIMRRPSDEFSANANVSYGSFDTVSAEAAVSGPVGDRVRLRSSLLYRSSDGYFENLLTGEKHNGTSNIAGRLLADIDVATNLELRLNLHGGSLDTDAPQYRSQGLLDPLTSAPCAIDAIRAGACGDALGYVSPSDFYEGEFNREGQLDVETWGGSATVNWDAGPFQIVSISAYEFLDKLQEEESDSSPNRLLEVDYGVKSKTFTQELRAVGEANRLKWLIGAYYLWEDLDQDQTADLFRDLRPLVESIDPISFPGGFDPDGASGVAPIFFSRTLNSQKTESFAVYGQIEFELTDRLNATVGGRYTTESRDFTSSVIFEEPTFEFPLFDFADGVDNDAFSWRFALDYHLQDDILLYASYSTGFKSGGFNGGFLFDPVALQPFDKETLSAYEAGFKSQFFDRRVMLNASGFYYDYKDLQVFTLVNTGGVPTQALDNAADARIYGFEMELGAEPVENLNVNLSLGYLDTELQNFQSSFGLDLSGNELALAPKWSVSGIVARDWPVASGTLTTQLNVNYRSHVFFSTENNPLIAQDGYALLGARIQYQRENSSWYMAVFGTNLTDKEYLSYAVDLSDFGFNQLMIAPGMSVGGEIGVKF